MLKIDARKTPPKQGTSVKVHLEFDATVPLDYFNEMMCTIDGPNNFTGSTEQEFIDWLGTNTNTEDFGWIWETEITYRNDLTGVSVELIDGSE